MRPFKHKRQAAKAVTDNRTYKIITWNDDPYWDEGVRYHRAKGKLRRNKRKKELTHKKYRACRTWKYNRKTKWKESIRAIIESQHTESLCAMSGFTTTTLSTTGSKVKHSENTIHQSG